MREETCNVCKAKGNLANMCLKCGGGVATGVVGGSDSGGVAKPHVPAIKQKIRIFAKVAMKENAKEGAEDMVVDQVFSVVVDDDPSGNVDWLRDSRASRHVCNDLSLTWDVRVRDNSILLRQLPRELEVYVTMTVKSECQNKVGVPVVLQLYNTLYTPQAKGNLFSLQKMKKAHYRVVQPQRIGTEWIQNESGQYVGNMDECGEGRAVVNCKTLLPLLLPPLLCR